MSEMLSQKIARSPFKNIYWFARYLINTDQYGALGKIKEIQLLNTIAILENIIIQNEMTDAEKLIVCKNTLISEIRAMAKPYTKNAALVNNFIELLNTEITSLEDVIVFCIAMKYVVVPINQAIASVPSNDIEFCVKAATSILDSLGEKKVGLVIATWDKLGTKGCLDAERMVVVEEFSKLLDNLEAMDIIEHNSLEDNLILTAFVQEFERRLGQKRKNRGGSSLEDVVHFIFNYYGFSSAEIPFHFDQDLEVDKWFKCKDGWSIGISCKRTLRERWKQVSQADRGTLSHFKIKELWHIITYDKDLSDDKVVRLGEQGQIFYLMDNSDTYLRCSEHIGMRNYVRPLSLIISDIRDNLGCK